MLPQSRAGWLWLLGAFFVPAISLGIPYLVLPYQQLEESGIVMGEGLLVLLLAAFVARAFGRTPVLLTAAVTTASLVTIVLLRVAVDTASDPTSHNLWPFEVVIALFAGGIASFAGVLLGSIPGWLRRA